MYKYEVQIVRNINAKIFSTRLIRFYVNVTNGPSNVNLILNFLRHFLENSAVLFTQVSCYPCLSLELL